MSLSCGGHNKPPKWKEVVGDIRGGGNNCYAYYIVNEVEYRIRFPKKYGSAQEGEKCYLRYNEYQPDEAKVLAWRVTYLPDEVTFKVEGYIKRIYWFSFSEPKHSFEYIYIIDGDEYFRAQTLPPHYKLVYPNLKVGQKFEVECWVDNPERAIMHLDRPIK